MSHAFHHQGVAPTWSVWQPFCARTLTHTTAAWVLFVVLTSKLILRVPMMHNDQHTVSQLGQQCIVHITNTLAVAVT